MVDHARIVMAPAVSCSLWETWARNEGLAIRIPIRGEGTGLAWRARVPSSNGMGGSEARMTVQVRSRRTMNAFRPRWGGVRRCPIARFAAGILVAFVPVSQAAQDDDAADYCLLHVEPFESFNAPEDVDDPRFSIDWCESDGDVVPSGFCPTGGHYRLDPNDRITARLAAVEACGRVRIAFLASSLFETWSRIEIGPATMDCGGPAVLTEFIDVSKGACTAFEIDYEIPETHLGEDLLVRWIHGGGSGVLLLDQITFEATGCCDPPGHSCCEIGSAGCDDAAIEACVCEIDPYCCETAWDALCIAAITEGGCGTCGSGCLTAFEADFGEDYAPGGPCLAFPELFETCSGVGPYLTTSGDCAGTNDAALRFGGGFPWSSLQTRCLDLGAVGTAVLRFSCAVPVGVAGPVVEILEPDGQPIEIFRVPFASEPGCREFTVDITSHVDVPGFRLRFRSGSSVAEATRLDDLRIELDPEHGACETGSPGCADPSIEACVCGFDGYCCETAWDAICVTLATLVCDAGCDAIPTCGTEGSCEAAKEDPGCEDESCCTVVCLLDPFCCVSAWDDFCVSAAMLECGSGLPGDLDGDGTVDGADIGLLLAVWGTADPDADLDGNGTVDGGDLGVLLAGWG